MSASVTRSPFPHRVQWLRDRYKWAISGPRGLQEATAFIEEQSAEAAARREHG